MTNREGGRFTAEEANKVGMPLRPLPAGRDGSYVAARSSAARLLLTDTSDAEMAATALYLASPAGAYMNGQTMVIDGGYIATNPSVI